MVFFHGKLRQWFNFFSPQLDSQLSQHHYSLCSEMFVLWKSLAPNWYKLRNVRSTCGTNLSLADAYPYDIKLLHSRAALNTNPTIMPTCLLLEFYPRNLVWFWTYYAVILFPKQPEGLAQFFFWKSNTFAINHLKMKTYKRDLRGVSALGLGGKK